MQKLKGALELSLDKQLLRLRAYNLLQKLISWYRLSSLEIIKMHQEAKRVAEEAASQSTDALRPIEFNASDAYDQRELMLEMLEHRPDKDARAYVDDERDSLQKETKWRE